MKAETSTLDKIRTRPRFKIHTALSPEEYKENLMFYLENNKEEFTGNINREMATISVKTKTDPYFKPYLSIRTEMEDEKTYIRGIFGPSSAVWTFFMFLYFSLSILWMVFITLWFVGNQIKSDAYHWALPVSLLILIFIGLTYFAAKYGQQKAKREMALLRRFAIESTLPYETEEI